MTTEATPKTSPVGEEVLRVVAARTLYDPSQLTLDSDLEGELGIDSIILESILGMLGEHFKLTDELPMGMTTLRELVAAVEESVGPDAVIAAAAPARPAAEAEEAEPEADELPAAAANGDPEWDSRSMKDFMEVRDPDLFAKARAFAEYRRRREQDRLYWYGMPMRSRSGARMRIYDEVEGREREFLMFASNNYLGLAGHPKVVDAICDATRTYGATHTGSRIIGGTNELHKELERRLAKFKKRPACAVFPGGYSANLGVIAGLVRNYDALVLDKLNHMSIVDGGKMAGATRKIFQHNDMADLERVLAHSDGQVMGKLIVVDGVFSMHGDVCDLPEIVRLAKAYGARVMVDDAHATGVLGATGSGTAEHFGLKGQVDLELGTMSKTLAGMGGFVVGEEDVIDYLRFYANSYVFAANIPPNVAAGLIASLDVMESEPERLKTLWDNIRTLRTLLIDAGFDLERSESAILPIVVGDDRKAMEMGRAVRRRGLFCQTVVFPGVSLGDARLRISITSEHTTADLEEAAGIFVEAGRETGVIPASGAAVSG